MTLQVERKQNQNGQAKQEPLAAILPPLALRELAGVEDLPFNELLEVRLAMATTQEVTHDALAELSTLPLDNATAEWLEQLAYANVIRAHYVERLNNLCNRLSRGDFDTWRHVTRVPLGRE